MSTQSFRDPPTVELLQWLARGSLKQNLPRAIRLWGWLAFLYGRERNHLRDPFTYSDWRDAFFSPTHPQGEAVPSLHDSQCRCATTTAAWLFGRGTGVEEQEWKESLTNHDSSPNNLEQLLASPLFGVTRRTLYEDLQILVKLGWVKRNDYHYHRVETLPSRPQTSPPEFRLAAYELNFLQPDLATVADNHSRQLNGVQRFFLHVDYVVSKATVDQVDEWQDQLRQLWSQTPVPCLKLTYHSAKLNLTRDYVVYPVCIYYVQRAIYLCGWGETSRGEEGWYNYRTDRIERLIPLAWTDRRIPRQLQQRYLGQTLPTPEDVEEQMAAAWGFDFYAPKRLMLLRFDRELNERYIKDSYRHETFQPISYERAKELIVEQVPTQEQRQVLLSIFQSRSSKDAYYQVHYREEDPNVIIRLRAWRPRVEIFLPWELRTQIADEVNQEWQLYHEFKKSDSNHAPV